MVVGAKVASVNTMNYDGKPKRRGMFFGKTKKYKKEKQSLLDIEFNNGTGI